MKKVIILEHDGGELANQLWNDASISAYAYERGVECENWSFYENVQYFKNMETRSFWTRLFSRILRGSHARKWGGMRPYLRKLYKALVVFPTRSLFSRSIIYSRGRKDRVYLLPPSASETDELKDVEKKDGTVFFSNISGCVFRNPVGVQKHYKKLHTRYAPALTVQKTVNEFLNPLRTKHKHLVGIHIRQGDYKKWRDGAYWIDQKHVREIINEYLHEFDENIEETLFVITSDGIVEEDHFTGLNYVVSKSNPGVDLFTLVECDVILGSHSTFGKFAAWLGNTPHFVIQKTTMDWTYYKAQKGYFEDKYFSFVV